MTIDVISLRKLMQLMLAPPALETSLLRSNIRADIKRQIEGPGSGGDFHTPFWADAKGHAAGRVDLRRETARRVDDLEQRARLYPLLRDGFLQWWEQRRRRRNEPFVVSEAQIHGRFSIEGLGIVKVDNNLGFSIGDDAYRVIYPYFCESPVMTAEIARLGLWCMSNALPGYRLEDMRILDVLRGVSFSISESAPQGNEEEQVRERYANLIATWNTLREEY